jgi:hypothetical protein
MTSVAPPETGPHGREREPFSSVLFIYVAYVDKTHRLLQFFGLAAIMAQKDENLLLNDSGGLNPPSTRGKP